MSIIFNFEKAYFILDEFIIGGEIQETSKKSAVKAIEDSDMLQEVSTPFLMPWEKMVVVAGGGGDVLADTYCLLCAGYSF